MKFRRLLPPPRRLLRWIAGVAVLGLVAPAAVAAMLSLAGYYPVGSWLPPSAFWSSFGIFLATVVIAALGIVAGALYSLLAWSWRPIMLAGLFELCLYTGVGPAVFAREHMQRLAFDLLESRSSAVVEGIAGYTRVEGTPPATLADLVPLYLPSVPQTGMAMAPNYHYEPQPGPCNFNSGLDNKWHLSVSVPEFFSVRQLFYCPHQGEWADEVFD